MLTRFGSILMQENTLNHLGNLFLALSDKTRLRLLSLMSDGEVSVGYLADSLGESQPKISRHLAYLRSAGLVSTRRDGKWIYYGVNAPTDPTAAAVMRAAFGQAATQALGASPVAEVEVQYIPPFYDSDPSYTYEETDMNEWQPQEMEIYLL
jgi:DNA-binding transcriptional ArsR family regulator